MTRKLQTRQQLCERIEAWAWARYMPYDRCFIGLDECCRYSRIVDMARSKYLGLREVYRGRPVLSCPTLRWKRNPVQKKPLPPLKERAGREWVYFTASGHIATTRADTKRQAIERMALVIGNPPVVDELFPL